MSPGQVLADILRQPLEPGRPAISDCTTTLSYGRLRELSEVAAGRLLERLPLGGHAGIFLPNGLLYAQAYFAAMNAGATVVPLDPRTAPIELASTVAYCETSLVITDRAHAGLLTGRLADLPFRIELLQLDDLSWTTLHPQRPALPVTQRLGGTSPEDVALLLHTSGTTSRPRRVMLQHAGLLANARAHIASVRLTAAESTLIVLPMYFGYCNTTQFLSHLLLGARITILPGGFTPRRFAETVARDRITNTTLVPALLQTLLSRRGPAPAGLSSLKLVLFGGSPMPPAHLRSLMESFPQIDFVQTYGQTEASPRITGVPREQTRQLIGSAGVPIPGVRLRVVDEGGSEVPPGEIGEITAAGPSLMRGYYKREQETAEALRGGWLHTGDLGRIDLSTGHLYLVGRRRNVIISAGQNIYAEEIEELLATHPEVAGAQAFAVAHPQLGEVPAVRVVPRGADPAGLPERVQDFCRRHLTPYKIPARVDLVGELPKTVTGKIRRFSEEEA